MSRLALALLLCGCLGARDVEAPLVLLPVSTSPAGVGAEVRLVVFGLTGADRPVVLGTGGAVSAFEWQGSSSRPGSVEVVVTTSSVKTKLFVQLASDGGVVESNRVRLETNELAIVEPPDVPAVVPWSASPQTSVLIVARDFGSGRLVDARGSPLPASSVRCARGEQALAESAMECFVTRQAPLETTGYGGSVVRAVVQTASGPVITPPAVLP